MSPYRIVIETTSNIKWYNKLYCFIFGHYWNPLDNIDIKYRLFPNDYDLVKYSKCIECNKIKWSSIKVVKQKQTDIVFETYGTGPR